jgi:lactoylglutathione lyase
MITGLYETHINVTDLDRSIEFYRDILGLELGRREDDRRVAFLWMGGWGQSMLGLWEQPRERVIPQHFAFRATVDDVLNKSVAWLNARSLPCHNFLKDGTQRPMVFAWMPAVSIYFLDPDGHSLELIAPLPEKPQPHLGVLSWEDWQTTLGPLPR